MFFHSITKMAALFLVSTFSTVIKATTVYEKEDKETINSTRTSVGAHIVLKKNVPFVEQVTQDNAVYVIRYDFDLDGAGINGKNPVMLPTNCVLQFEGGCVNNGTIIFNETEIIGTRGFGKELTFAGNIQNPIIDLSFFKDNTEPLYNIGKLLGNYNIYNKSGQSYNSGKTFLIPQGHYTVSRGLSIHGVSDIVIDGCGSTFTDVISTIEEHEFITTPLIWVADASGIIIKNINYKYCNKKKLDSFNSSIIYIGARGLVTNNFKTHTISVCNISGDSFGFIPPEDDNYGLNAIGVLGEVQNVFIAGCKWTGPIKSFANFEWSSKGTQEDNYYGLRPNNISVDNIVLEDIAYHGRCKGIRVSSSYNISISNVYAHNCDNSISFYNGDYGIARVHQTAKFDNIVHKNDKLDFNSRAFYFMTLYKDSQDYYPDVVNYHPAIFINNCVMDNLSGGIILNNIEGNVKVQNCIFNNDTSGIGGYVLYNEGNFMIDNSLFKTCEHAIVVDNKSLHITNSIFIKSENRYNDIRPQITHSERYGKEKQYIIEKCQFKTIGTRNSVDIRSSIDVNSYFSSLIIRNNIFEQTSIHYPAVLCSQFLYTHFDSNEGDYITSGVAVADEDDEKKGVVATANYNSENVITSLCKWNKVKGSILDARFSTKYLHDEGDGIVSGVMDDDFVITIKITKINSGDLTIIHNASDTGSSLPIYISGYSRNETNVPFKIVENGIIQLVRPFRDAKFFIAVFEKML